MSRSTRRGANGDGLHETDAPVQIKPERTTRTSSRRAHVNENDEDNDAPNGDEQLEAGPSGPSGADDDEREGSPKGRKRARKNTVGDSHTTADDDGEAEVKIDMENLPTTLPRDPKDNFVPGSIVRIQLNNFVTYDFVEFRPGPYLNMILGPNGTGKSTIASAICVGLNYPVQLLNRANEINLYVKKECLEGYVEIELKGPQGKRNIVIRRKLSAKSKVSTFTLNGRSSTGREVSEKIAELNIQVGNLCSFLPQDKVADFARMTPEELLRQTQKAAGDPRLTQWHDTLISAGKDMREVTEQLTTEREQLRVAEDRNKLLENDVERFKQRQILERDIDLLKLAVPVCEYLEAKDTYDISKKDHKLKHARVVRLKERNKPAHTFKEELQSTKATLLRQRNTKTKQTSHYFTQMKRVYQEHEKLEKEAEGYQDDLDRIRENEQARIRQIAKYEETVQKHQRELDNPPEIEDEAPLAQRQRELNQESSGVRDRQQAFQARQRSIIDESGRQKAEIEEAMRGINELENVAEQKLRQIRRMDPDTAETILWLRNPNNQRRFKMQVFEPPAVAMKVENQRYVNAIEACLSQQQMKTFVVQCPEDSALLNRLVNDSDEALGHKGRIPVWFRPRGDLPPPPLAPEEMQQLGFDGYALDYINCPDGLLWFLQKDANMHRTAIALNPSAVDTNRAMEAISTRGGGGGFIVGKVMNQVSRSAYGQRLATNQTRDIGAAKVLAGYHVDESQKREFDVRIADARKNLAELELQQRGMSDEEGEINDLMAGFKREMEDLKQRRANIRLIKGRLLKLQSEIDSTRKALNEARKRPSGEENKARLKQKLYDTARRRAKVVKEYADFMREIVKTTEEATLLGMNFIQTLANLEELEKQIKKKDQKYEQAEAEWRQAQEKYEHAKQDVKLKLQTSKQVVADAQDDIKELFHTMEGRLQAHEKEKLQTELADMNARLDLFNATNPGVVEQYERRKIEIANLQSKIEQREKNQSKIQRNIDAAKSNWYPALQRLIASIGEKFSTAFDRIGCAGEIRIQQHEDFAKWAITILVKFRDTDKLQPLTGSRQSGGERSLTTIMYLMSLTEQARAPFSLVDEINQGMDQRAERAVHDQMVEVTCAPDACQYFLITPKLLPGLKYHPRMKLLCINNGEWLPEEKGLGNMMSMIDRYAARRAQGTGAA